MKIIAKRDAFTRARLLRGLTQRELARKAGLSHSYISLLERSVKTAGPRAAKRISDALDLSVEELFDIGAADTTQK